MNSAELKSKRDEICRSQSKWD